MDLDLCFSDIVDIKPANMEELTEVITAAEFHPDQCNTFVYSSSKGTIRLCDMRASALCDQHAKSKSLTTNTCLREGKEYTIFLSSQFCCIWMRNILMLHKTQKFVQRAKVLDYFLVCIVINTIRTKVLTFCLTTWKVLRLNRKSTRFDGPKEKYHESTSLLDVLDWRALKFLIFIWDYKYLFSLVLFFFYWCNIVNETKAIYMDQLVSTI